VDDLRKELLHFLLKMKNINEIVSFVSLYCLIVIVFSEAGEPAAASLFYFKPNGCF
jgi:hypothetical protein